MPKLEQWIRSQKESGPYLQDRLTRISGNSDLKTFPSDWHTPSRSKLMAL